MTGLEIFGAVSLILFSPTAAFFITRAMTPKTEGVTTKSFFTWLVLAGGLSMIEFIVLMSLYPPTSGL